MRMPTTRRDSVLRGALAVLAAGASASMANAQAKNWNAAAGDWSIPANWSRFGLPGPANQVFIGNMAIAENAFVTLDVNASINSLSMTDGMGLRVLDGQLVVAGATTIAGVNDPGKGTIYPSRLGVLDTPAALDAILDDLTVSDGGLFEIADGVCVVGGMLTLNDGTIMDGTGLLRLTGDTPIVLLNNGSISAGVGLLRIVQEGQGRIDLDGSVAGDGKLNLTLANLHEMAFAKLTIEGTSLVDAMDDDIWIGGGNELTMSLSEGWTMGSSTLLRFFTIAGLPAMLHGNHATLNGAIDFVGTGVHALITAPVTFGATTAAELGAEDILECDGPVTVLGGTYTMGQGAHIEFHGDTTMKGGTFTSFSSSPDDGGVLLDGPTSYDGAIVFSGFARQEGDAGVDGPTTITCDVFDMDGSGGSATWTIGNALVVNASKIDNEFNKFDGTMKLTGTFLGKLTVNLDGPGDAWFMDGTLDVGGVAAIMTTRLEGSHVKVTGDIEVSNRVRITADATLESGSAVDFAGPGARLRFAGKTKIVSNTTFTGGGTVENAADGDMTIAQGASLNGCGLTNDGALRLGDSPGLVSVGTTTFGATSKWEVELGGPVPGFEHDVLLAFGSVALGGELDVRLIDLGGGVFEPSVGDTFTILQGPPGALNGAFTNQPVSFVPGKAYVWTVGYELGGASSNVLLKVNEIIPCPADLNGDGLINGADLAILLGSWGPCPGCVADINLDDEVDGSDLAILLGAWGECSTT